jgi:aspartyl-tRNA(Asn)/glutamyl-tRNA(Gln) amidotransferase subunit C
LPKEISRQVFDHLVELAALALSEEEAEYLRGELNKQLKAIRELEGIELPPDVPITSHGVDYREEISAPPRPDEAAPSELADGILAQAPEVHERFIVVPDIPSEELE